MLLSIKHRQTKRKPSDPIIPVGHHVMPALGVLICGLSGWLGSDVCAVPLKLPVGPRTAKDLDGQRCCSNFRAESRAHARFRESRGQAGLSITCALLVDYLVRATALRHR
jgi:hypothetical protein